MTESCHSWRPITTGDAQHVRDEAKARFFELIKRQLVFVVEEYQGEEFAESEMQKLEADASRWSTLDEAILTYVQHTGDLAYPMMAMLAACTGIEAEPDGWIVDEIGHYMDWSLRVEANVPCSILDGDDDFHAIKAAQVAKRQQDHEETMVILDDSCCSICGEELRIADPDWLICEDCEAKAASEAKIFDPETRTLVDAVKVACSVCGVEYLVPAPCTDGVICAGCVGKGGAS